MLNGRFFPDTKEDTMPQRTYAVVGLGAIGLVMAQSLLRAGLKTIGCNRGSRPLQAFAAHGGQTTHAPAEAAARADVLFLAVVNAAQAEDVLFGQGGAARAMRAGGVVINCVTVRPAFAVDMERRLAALGLLYLDAPVSGGPAQSAAGRLSVMASGSPEAFAGAEIGLSAVAAVVHRLGNEAGKGSAMKVVNQLLAGTHIAVAAEAMALGLRMGLDAGDIYKVITSAAANSWMFETRMKHVVSGDYTPLSAVDIFVKDLGIV
ncbi:NAD(P)-dependent oxidoreductase, partial [uncultured Desulfovibrio sp.]|uniref:NAD(P)-dependent oxidoreductase n=1 Tax=uncultured Desulfovibrio sp. TaxID=167968 RepID=UPI00266EB1EA